MIESVSSRSSVVAIVCNSSLLLAGADYKAISATHSRDQHRAPLRIRVSLPSIPTLLTTDIYRSEELISKCFTQYSPR
jgi:hypothetical protein